MKTSTNIILAAIIAFVVTLYSHELTHLLLGLVFGTKIVSFCSWAVTMVTIEVEWQRAIVQGSAAIVNIIMGFFAAAKFWKTKNGMTRAFLYYLAAFSWLVGFGYLLSDPILASSDRNGDWAKVINLLGGSWGVRLPILLVGLAGYTYTIYWLAKATQAFKTSDPETLVGRTIKLLIVPYFVVNILFTLLSFWHPVPELRLMVAIKSCWLGNFGFFAAAVGTYFQYKSTNVLFLDNFVEIPRKLSVNMLVIALLVYATAAYFAVPRILNVEVW